MVGMKLAIACIDRLLAKHQKVIVAWLYGNHDENASIGVLAALTFKFENNPRVEIRLNTSKFFAHRHRQDNAVRHARRHAAQAAKRG